jgi:glycosyltransferase involved in cell wall biosynthesis
MQQFWFIITAFNVQPFLEALVGSIARQRWTAWKAVFVDDGSTDGTLDALRGMIDRHRLGEKFEIVANHQRRHKTYNVYQAIKSHGGPDDVIAILDGDDHLAVDDALDRLARQYDQGWEVVWSNWRGSDGSRGTSSHLNPFISPRRQPHVASHLLSFKRRLFDAVVESDLQDDEGKWFEAGCDVAIAWPVLDQTIKRKHIEDVLYIYNRDNPLNHGKAGPVVRPLVTPDQARTPAILSRRPGKPLVVDHEFLLAHLYELMHAATISSRVAARQEIGAAMRQESGKPKAEGR